MERGNIYREEKMLFSMVTIISQGTGTGTCANIYSISSIKRYRSISLLSCSCHKRWYNSWSALKMHCNYSTLHLSESPCLLCLGWVTLQCTKVISK